MGISCSDERDKYLGYGFTIPELTKMKEIFTQISSEKPKSESRKTLSKLGFKKRFPENVEFALKLYHWMRAHSEKDAITFETYVTLLQVLVKQLDSYHSLHYKSTKLEKFEIFLQISLGKYTQNDAALTSSNVTFSQALIFLQEIFNIFNTGKTSSEPNSLAAKLIVNSIFKNDQTSINWREFTKYIKEKYPNINKVVQDYFTTKFVNPDVKIKTPALGGVSGNSILNADLISIFCLTDPQFFTLPKINLLYSSDTQGKSFYQLANAIKNNPSPSIVIIKHVETGKSGQSSNEQAPSYVCGAFIKAPWKNNIRYSGNNETVLFSLIPRFRIFNATNAQENKNFVYLNTDAGSRIGLGFGGVDYKGFKLWIDDKLENESYTNDNDGTYENGPLLEPYITKLNITSVEVWSVEGEYKTQTQTNTPRPTQTPVQNEFDTRGSYVIEKTSVVEKTYTVDLTGTELEKKSYYNNDPYLSPGRGSHYSNSPTRGTEYSYTPTPTNTNTTHTAYYTSY